MPPRFLRILAVDDVEMDRRLLEVAMTRAGPDCILDLAASGEEALGRLKEEPPDLVLLDLDMPGMTGRDVLSAIRRDPRSQHIPVVMLSSGWRTQDIEWCYRLGCSGYIRKPTTFSEFVEVLEGLVLYWTAVVVRPRRRPSLPPSVDRRHSM